MIKDHYTKNFFGLKTRWESESIKSGYASEGTHNWTTKADHIELRRGQELFGTAVEGPGNISGLAVGQRFDGEEVLIETYDRKVKYYDETTEDWIETSTADILPAAASGEDISISTYHSLAGAMFYLSSKNSSIYKLPMANPASIVDQTSTDHRGKIRIKQSGMWLWDRKDASGGFDTTGLYRSKLDKDELADYSSVTAENGFTGAVNGSNKDYTVTLAFKGGGAKRTCMYVSVYATTGAGVETFRDSRNGTLVSNFGGTGTINYATGEVAVSFFNAPSSGSVLADYYYEDSTSGGIVDFAYSSTRTAGQGITLRQDEGGADFQNLFSLGATEYCFHGFKTWALSISADDLDASNQIYRAKVGIPYWRAGCETGDGIYYVDATDPSSPAIRLLYIGGMNSQVLPKSISEDLNLSGYNFDQACLFEWGNFICVSCRTLNGTANDTVFMFDRLEKTWDLYDFRVSIFEKYQGGLIAGDSASRNTFRLFAGLTDEEANIPNAWVSNKDRLGVEGSKYFNIFKVKGFIDPDQEYDIYFSYDNGGFVKVGTITGTGTYVDTGNSVVIGSHTLGSETNGGGGDRIEASPYEREFRVNTPIFESYRVKFVATKVGYVSITEYAEKDIRYKGRRVAPQYSST